MMQKRSGVPESSNYTSVTDDGVTVYHTVLADYGSKKGDSGGIIYIVVNGDAVPAGINRASNGSQSVFCTVQKVIDYLDVTPY